MNYKTIDSELGIASCSYQEICEKYKEKNTVLFIYYSPENLILLNEDNPSYEKMKELICLYVGAEDLTKKEILSNDVPKDFRKIFGVLNRIIRIRRKLHKVLSYTGNAAPTV